MNQRELWTMGGAPILLQLIIGPFWWTFLIIIYLALGTCILIWWAITGWWMKWIESRQRP